MLHSVHISTIKPFQWQSINGPTYEILQHFKLSFVFTYIHLSVKIKCMPFPSCNVNVTIVVVVVIVNSILCCVNRGSSTTTVLFVFITILVTLAVGHGLWHVIPDAVWRGCIVATYCGSAATGSEKSCWYQTMLCTHGPNWAVPLGLADVFLLMLCMNNNKLFVDQVERPKRIGGYEFKSDNQRVVSCGHRQNWHVRYT